MYSLNIFEAFNVVVVTILIPLASNGIILRKLNLFMEIEMFWLCIELSTYQHFHVFIANCVHTYVASQRNRENIKYSFAISTECGGVDDVVETLRGIFT